MTHQREDSTVSFPKSLQSDLTKSGRKIARMQELFVIAVLSKIMNFIFALVALFLVTMILSILLMVVSFVTELDTRFRRLKLMTFQPHKRKRHVQPGS